MMRQARRRLVNRCSQDLSLSYVLKKLPYRAEDQAVVEPEDEAAKREDIGLRRLPALWHWELIINAGCNVEANDHDIVKVECSTARGLQEDDIYREGAKREAVAVEELEDGDEVALILLEARLAHLLATRLDVTAETHCHLVLNQ